MADCATVKVTVKKTVTLPGYLPVELFEFSVAGRVVYWPMLARPGRRRWTRQAFDNPEAAALYGGRLAARFGRIYDIPHLSSIGGRSPGYGSEYSA